jgi:hypothetical protein
VNDHSKYSDRVADLIKLAAIITAMPRWTAALMAAEGFMFVPESWRLWWTPVAAILSAAMSVVEGLGFNYAFRAWRAARPDSQQARTLMGLIIASAAVVAIIMTPVIYLHISSSGAVGKLPDVVLWFWSLAVSLSTPLLVGVVGYAQKKDATVSKAQASELTPKLNIETETHDYPCKLCDFVAHSSSSMANHVRWQHGTSIPKNGKGVTEDVETTEGVSEEAG